MCGAPTRRGRPCERTAGWGTDHPGQGWCRVHDGRFSDRRDPGGDRSDDNPDPDLISPDPAIRLGALARLMSRRVIAASRAAGPASDAAETRIVRAVQAAIQATRAELIARKAQADTAEPPAEIIVTVRKVEAGDEEGP
jgi:hypothetical protein